MAKAKSDKKKSNPKTGKTKGGVDGIAPKQPKPVKYKKPKKV